MSANLCAIARQSFFAVLDCLASDALRCHSNESGRARPSCEKSPCLVSMPAATIRVNLRVCAQQHAMGGIIGRSTIKLNRRA